MYVLGSFFLIAVKRHTPFFFVAKFCRENLRTFFTDFFGLRSKIRTHFYSLDVCVPDPHIAYVMSNVVLLKIAKVCQCDNFLAF